MKLTSPANSNYCATVVSIGNIVALPNRDRVVGAIVSGYQVIVGKDYKPGDKGIFFPVETRLSDKFCSENNLNADHKLNKDQTKKGYIYNGRLKCVAFAGNKSEGLFLPLSCLSYVLSKADTESLKVGDEFDALNGELVCEKFAPKVLLSNKNERNLSKYNPAAKNSTPRLIESQFNFHIDTNQLKKNMWKIKPSDIVSITDKWHGQSFIVSKPLVLRKLTFTERLLKKFGVKIQETMNDLVYSSRGVIKNKTYGSVVSESDKWKIAADRLKDIIPDGITIYGELVGYDKLKALQPKYMYGCKAGEMRTMVYRVTLTNNSGQVFEFTWDQIKNFCGKYGIEHVPEFFYGRAKDIFPDISPDPTKDEYGNITYPKWSEAVLARLCNSFNMEKECAYNPGQPAEGVVFRVDNLFKFDAYKLKSYNFLLGESAELDKGVVDEETAQKAG